MMINSVSYRLAQMLATFSNPELTRLYFGPGSIEQAHKPDEYIEISQLMDGIKFMDKLTLWAQRELEIQ